MPSDILRSPSGRAHYDPVRLVCILLILIILLQKGAAAGCQRLWRRRRRTQRFRSQDWRCVYLGDGLDRPVIVAAVIGNWVFQLRRQRHPGYSGRAAKPGETAAFIAAELSAAQGCGGVRDAAH